MEVISESKTFENKELLPQILMRIFTVCKTDPNFPLKHKMSNVEGEVDALNQRLEKQKQLLENTIGIRNDLSNKLQLLRQENFEMKSRLLEELGSEI